MNSYILTTDNGGYAEYVYGIMAENDEEAFFIYKESEEYLKNEKYEIVDRDKGMYKVYSKVYGTVYITVTELKLEENKCVYLGGYGE